MNWFEKMCLCKQKVYTFCCHWLTTNPAFTTKYLDGNVTEQAQNRATDHLWYYKEAHI